MSAADPRFGGSLEDAMRRADRIVENPGGASDVDLVLAIADYLDVLDLNAGRIGQTEMQDFLRDLAARIERGETVPEVRGLTDLGETP